ncbi:MAG TPA: tRNA (N6-isopentenyl adenosine(37)-C2)-methylthiotransferase MiaB [Bacteroidia bacterium]|jgi:tRNA-2-methylthio-N6-dimethylallyladenosine synthase|nr:tRNA (N6-isopentenyl adenosine(37)-C2)-methylthiotransferase MiaB [Bacteroidia bacterium]
MENKVIDENRQGEALMMETEKRGTGKKLFIESYGCAMNFSDSEIVASVLTDQGYSTTQNYKEADLILINTCAIRDGAEQRVRNRLKEFNIVKRLNPSAMVGVMGCMAERLKSKFLEEEKIVDIVVGPDSYRDLPHLIETVEGGQKAVNVLLSRDETYADINPVRLGSNGITAFISITRGCDNMCSFCVVPFTRGRERSREPESIVNEARSLFEQGYREVTLLGQNVDSYLWTGGGLKKDVLSEEEQKNAVSFAALLEKVALVNPMLRVRFSTSHPKDMTDEVLHVMARYENICDYIHLPVQSGNSRLLNMMNRGYDREWYMNRINAIRRIIPGCAISTDIITGFCSETEEEHRDTVSLMEWVGYDFAYMFAYSERPKTLAERKYKDDVPEEVKKSRLTEIVALQQKLSAERTKSGLGKIHRVLVEGVSKKSEDMLSGRNSQNTVVVFPKKNYKKGDYVNVLAERCTVATLIGTSVD